jgi:predicted Zn finger-like uncharacterized protein
MAISVTCPGCRTSYPVTQDLLGKTIRCKKCQETFIAKAARSAVAAGKADERIQTARVVEEDDDFEPRNGTHRPAAKKKAEAGNNNAMIIAGSIGGVTLLGLVGALIWALNRDTEDTPKPAPPTGLVFNNPTPAIPSTSTETRSTDSPTSDKKPPETPSDKLTETKPANAPTTAQMVTSTEIFGGVRLPRPAEFKPEVVEQAKKGAVFIYCVFEQGGAFGSGWVAEKKGDERYIVTNAHVVGMKEREKPAPDKIDITFPDKHGNCGSPEARTLEGKLLALDRDEDLAVIRVKGPDLPEPLKVAPSFDLIETQKMLVLGFPFGGNLRDLIRQGLGVEVTTSLKARPTTVAGRMFNKEDGSVKYVQIEGGAEPGNSGGACVDTNGNVSGVLVAGDPSSNMRWIIPSEYVIHLLAGRILDVIPGQAVVSGSSLKQPLRAQIADPLKRLRSVSVDVWPGLPPQKGQIVRSASATQPQPQEGDGAHISATLSFNPDGIVRIGEAHSAEAELNLPPLAPGQVYWFQPKYVSKDGKERWGEAIVLEMGRHPVEAKPAMIAIKHKPDLKPDDLRRVEVTSTQLQGIELEGIGGLGTSELSIKAFLTEKTRLVEPNGNALVRLQYSDIKLNDAERDSQFRQQLRGVIDQVKNVGTEVTITADGRFRQPKPDFAQVPQGARPVLQRFHSQVIESLESLSLSLPNKDMQPGDTWEAETAYTIGFTLVSGQNRTENALFKTTCKYIGSRERNGRREAVVELTGSVVRNENAGGSSGGSGPPRPGTSGRLSDVSNYQQPDSGSDSRRRPGVYGASRGSAVIDLETGLVTAARSDSDIVVVSQVTIRGPNNQEAAVNVHIGFTLETVLQRSLNKGKVEEIKDIASILPNLPRSYNPLVGVGSPMTASASTPSTVTIPALRGNMAPDVLDRVQKAAVRIDVETVDGGGSGSGWFAEPGMVVTNCHVVDMESKSARKPKKITVVIDSGTSAERKIEGKLVTIDRENDLAVIRVEGANLPEPMKIAPAESLIETQRLTVVGFPYGTSVAENLRAGLGARNLSTTVKTRTTSVSGRVHAADESIRWIQYEGGGDPGNSGSAVVDGDGKVRCVHVAGMPDPRTGRRTQMKFGIPAEYAIRIIQGFPLEIETPFAFYDGSIARQPVEIKIADPVRRVTKASIDVWVGAPGKPRHPTESMPKEKPGDSVPQTFPLRLEADPSGLFMNAVGDFPLPSRGAGQVYWMRPRFINSSGKEQWGRAVAYSPDGPPVRREAIVLNHKLPQPGTERTIELSSEAIYRWQRLDERKVEGNPLKATITETIVQPRRGTSLVQMAYKDLIWDLPLSTGDPRFDSEIRNLLRQFTDLIKGIVTVMTINKEGLLKAPATDYRNVPIGGALFAKSFNDQLMQSLIAMSIPFPNKKVDYLDKWSNPTNLFIETRNRYEASLFNMNFKYLGVRDNGGRLEAVIEIDGSLATDPKGKSIDDKEMKSSKPGDPPPAGEPSGNNPIRPGGFREQMANRKTRALYGTAKGHAFLDVRGGYVAEVKLFIDLEVEMTSKDPDTKAELPVPASGTMTMHFRRMDNMGSR